MQSLLNFVLNPDNVRRLGATNVAEVEKLTLKNTEYLFGYYTPASFLTKSYLSLGVYNEDDELCGVLCLNDYPNVPAIPPWEWRHWLHNLYRLDRIYPLTTLWIHYSVWDRRYTTIFLSTIFQWLFYNEEYIEQVLWACPPGIIRLDFIDHITTRHLPYGFENASRVQTIYIAKREDFVAHYVIRRAVEEDNDDLVAIIPQVVEDAYGHYYISEILSNPEETGRQIIVAEYRGCAVGVLCLNEIVSYDLLNEEFELMPYNGFKKPDEDDEFFLKAQVPSSTVMPVMEDPERLSTFVMYEEFDDAPTEPEETDNVSEDEFSLLNLSSSLILNYLYEDDVSEPLHYVESSTSIESHFSAVILNEDYEDHLYNADKSDLGYDERRTTRQQRAIELPEIPHFHGEPNAFTLEICTALDEHEGSLFLLFQAAFQCFPDRDYCVTSFPPSSPNYFLMKHFARVIPRPGSVFHHELYVLHKNAVLGRLSARVALPSDKAQISEMITQMVKPSIIEEQFKEAVDPLNHSTKGYVFCCEKQVVGCAVIVEEDEHEYIELHYNIDPWVDPNSFKMGVEGSLEELIISPIFQRHVSFFLRELHRLSGFDVLYYRLKRNDYVFTHRTLPIINSLGSMVPILPNMIPEYDDKIAEEYLLPSVLSKSHQPFSLYLSTTKILSKPKIEINHRLVVVGAGLTALSFLESLIYSRHPTALVVFMNITVVSPHGISYHKQPNATREMVFVSNGRYDGQYMDKVCFKTYVHVVTGVMTSINRKEKYVGLNDDTFVPYDYLLLLCGEQFQKPPEAKKEMAKKETKKRVEFPQNVFIINTEADAGNAFNALKNLSPHKLSGNVVVFGHYLEACCCLAALLEFGVAANNLVYVDPTPGYNPVNDRHDHLTQFFNNSDVEMAVLDEILAQGITIYQDYNFLEWNMDSGRYDISSAKFESKYKFVEIELSAFFIYYAKGVSTRTFQAIARSGLVFNGRLVIDKNFQTNDPNIFGAGPLTMYSKKYYAEHLQHKYYNGEEIGFMLGQEIRKKMVPRQFWDIPERPALLRKPIVHHCRFPGNLYYLQVAKPGRPVPLDVAKSKSHYGKVMVSGDCKSLHKLGYFRLHLNQYNVVETITCLAKFPLKVQNLMCLWGKHEVLLNNLNLRYEMNMIPDLFDYFSQPWAYAIYHKRFHSLMDELDLMFILTETDEGKSLILEVKKMFEDNDWRPLTKLQNDEIEEMCRDTDYANRVEEKVVTFLHNYYMYLPMYVHQMLIRWIMHQIQTSPLFVKTTFIIDADKSKNIHQVMPFFQKQK